MKNKYGRYFEPEMPLSFENNNPFRHMNEQEEKEEYMAYTLKASIIETIRFENEDCRQGITIEDAFEQAQNQGFKISFQEYSMRFREIEKSHPCPSFSW